MPTKPIKKFTSWSYSRYDDYMMCPAFARYKHLDKMPVPQGPALARGDTIHKEAHAYVTGRLRRLPASLQLFKQEFTALRKIDGDNEDKLALSARWEIVDFFDWDKAWCRMIVDRSHIDPKTPKLAHIIDYKTGRTIKPNYVEQLELYAVAMFIKHPQVQRVKTGLWFLDQGDIKDETYTRGDLQRLINTWQGRVRGMLRDTRFAPRPGDRCRYCPFSASKGGPCKY